MDTTAHASLLITADVLGCSVVQVFGNLKAQILTISGDAYPKSFSDRLLNNRQPCELCEYRDSYMFD